MLYMKTYWKKIKDVFILIAVLQYLVQFGAIVCIHSECKIANDLKSDIFKNLSFKAICWVFF